MRLRIHFTMTSLLEFGVKTRADKFVSMFTRIKHKMNYKLLIM